MADTQNDQGLKEIGKEVKHEFLSALFQVLADGVIKFIKHCTHAEALDYSSKKVNQGKTFFLSETFTAKKP